MVIDGHGNDYWKKTIYDRLFPHIWESFDKLNCGYPPYNPRDFIEQAVIPRDAGVIGALHMAGAALRPTPGLRDYGIIRGGLYDIVVDEVVSLRDYENIMKMSAEFSAVAAEAYKNLSIAEFKKAIKGAMTAKAKRAARKATGRAAAESRPKLNPRDLSAPQLAAVVEDSTLGRLHRRYTELLATVELPKGGLKSVEQAQAAARLASTYEGLQRRRTELGLEPLPKDERVTEAQRLKTAFYRQTSPKPSARKASLG
jgi:hypothetical protein